MSENKLPKKIELKIKNFVKSRLADADVAHDFEHAERVVNLSKIIGKKEDANLRILIPAAYLHDISPRDKKKPEEHFSKATKVAEGFLKSLNEFSIQEIQKIKKTILAGSSEQYMNDRKIKSIEEMVLRDAGILDALGAIGVGREFAFGGHIKLKLGNLDDFQKPLNRKSVVGYFYSNLLKRQKRLKTKTGKQLGVKRHRFLEIFLEQYKKELLGKL
jgi:uncharacterized protein